MRIELFRYSIALLSGSLFVFSSCKNDLKLSAPYREIPSVYAVLNAYEPLQMIRVNKVFLGDGDATVMAKVADSINYKQDELSISLKHSVKPNIIEFKDSMVIADEGAFNVNQRVYISREKLETSGTYTLTIKNNKTGNIFLARASAIEAVQDTQYYGNLTAPYSPYPPTTDTKYYIDYKTNEGAAYFRPVEDNTKVYQLIIRSHFYNDFGSYKVNDYVDYVFANRYPKDATIIGGFGGSPHIKTNFRPIDYFSAVGLGLSKKNLTEGVLGRKMFLIEYLIYSSTQEYIDFLEYNKPSFGFNQNKPLYSNFDNASALGIFTFRTRTSIKKDMATTMVNAFSSDPNTCKYKFYDSNNTILGCK
jgi:hypothetical protein